VGLHPGRLLLHQVSAICQLFWELFKLFLNPHSILLWIFDRWSPFSYQNNKEKYKDDPEEEKREFTLKESLWFCMTSLTPQVGDFHFDFKAEKFVFL
jgi:Ligand-gated ion channel